MTKRLRIGKHVVNVSNPSKVLFPGDGITKGDVVDYYRRVARRMLPHLRGRPVAMQRFPDGIDAERIFQKSTPAHFPEWVTRASLEKREGGRIEHVVIDRPATLVYLADQACLTPHVWLSTVDRPNHPREMIFDLDPPDGFDAARQAALALREVLDELGLPALVKTTGGRGLHVKVPLDRTADFDEVRSFARGVAEVLVSEHPDHMTIEQRKAKRHGRLYLDVMRNGYAQTAVPAFAVRARPGAPVAMPIEWSELDDPDLEPGHFTIDTVEARLDKIGDPWAGGARRGRSLRAARRRLQAIGQR